MTIKVIKDSNRPILFNVKHLFDNRVDLELIGLLAYFKWMEESGQMDVLGSLYPVMGHNVLKNDLINRLHSEPMQKILNEY